MSKQAKARRLAPTEAVAKVRTLRTSARKLNLVAASIRGLKVQRALNELEFSPKRIAQDVRKALYSAVSNAENNHSLDIDSLVVAEAFVGKNLVMKRFAARARGRASRIEKPFSELTIIVRELGEAV
ncbi:50S ribosomal protein L22 [Phenylobacterium sp.]|jgi:large subunit ribosomal protein L22|uniref:50S ribosomal protein L22 n=1 Tax=Phenylobacterium sp. TaxID=1871053 RepID=UPI002F411D61